MHFDNHDESQDSVKRSYDRKLTAATDIGAPPTKIDRQPTCTENNDLVSPVDIPKQEQRCLRLGFTFKDMDLQAPKTALLACKIR